MNDPNADDSQTADNAPRRIPTDLITVGKFYEVNSAELAVMQLNEEGIEAYIADATIVSMDWLLANAIGWVKVQVATADAERARAIILAARAKLAQSKGSSSSEADFASGDMQCLSCGAAMPVGVATCPACGWTYLGPSEE
jgi:hypothetical protein